MIILHPVRSITEMFVDDLKENPKGWLKFLFVESPIGWVLSGVLLFILVVLVLAVIGLVSLF